MKINKLVFLFLLVLNGVFAQEKPKDSLIKKTNQNKWALEIGTGMSVGTRPYTDGYFSSVNNQLFDQFRLNSFNLGVRYNYTYNIGLKMDLAFDRFTNNKNNRSLPFEVAQFRTSIQAFYNLNTLIKKQNNATRFNLLLHSGASISSLKPIKNDYNTRVSNGDYYGSFVIGITPMLQITKKTALYLDLSSFSNYGQNLTWNGKNSKTSENSNGKMLCWNFGLSFALGNNKESK